MGAQPRLEPIRTSPFAIIRFFPCMSSVLIAATNHGQDCRFLLQQLPDSSSFPLLATQLAASPLSVAAEEHDAVHPNLKSSLISFRLVSCFPFSFFLIAECSVSVVEACLLNTMAIVGEQAGGKLTGCSVPCTSSSFLIV